jgi:hypothetical protein
MLLPDALSRVVRNPVPRPLSNHGGSGSAGFLIGLSVSIFIFARFSIISVPLAHVTTRLHPAASNQLQHKDDNRDYKQKMNEIAHRRTAKAETQSPQYK